MLTQKITLYSHHCFAFFRRFYLRNPIKFNFSVLIWNKLQKKEENRDFRSKRLAIAEKKNFSSHPAGRGHALWGGQICALQIGCILGYSYTFRQYRPLKSQNGTKKHIFGENSGSETFNDPPKKFWLWGPGTPEISGVPEAQNNKSSYFSHIYKSCLAGR